MRFDIIIRGPARKWEMRNVSPLHVLEEVAIALYRGDMVTVGRSDDVRKEFPLWPDEATASSPTTTGETT